MVLEIGVVIFGFWPAYGLVSVIFLNPSRAANALCTVHHVPRVIHHLSMQSCFSLAVDAKIWDGKKRWVMRVEMGKG